MFFFLFWSGSDRVVVAEFEEQERDAQLAAMDVRTPSNNSWTNQSLTFFSTSPETQSLLARSHQTARTLQPIHSMLTSQPWSTTTKSMMGLTSLCRTPK